MLLPPPASTLFPYTTLFRSWGGSIRFATPLLFSLGFISMFIMGGLSGVMHASPPVDLQQTDTYFIVAHFHYVLRSEEHTSELQSRQYLVCRLLLEKKKQTMR